MWSNKDQNPYRQNTEIPASQRCTRSSRNRVYYDRFRYSDRDFVHIRSCLLNKRNFQMQVPYISII